MTSGYSWCDRTTHRTGLANSASLIIHCLLGGQSTHEFGRQVPLIMMRVLLIIVLLLCSSLVAVAQELDILELAARQPRGVKLVYPDGTYRIPKFGDPDLEQAEKELADYPRPWTLSKVLAWYREADAGKARANLLWVLAASRDPRAALALGEALYDESLEVRWAATYGLLEYFNGMAGSGGTEQHMAAAREWWEKNRERL
jgi:hypothetical protein